MPEHQVVHVNSDGSKMGKSPVVVVQPKSADTANRIGENIPAGAEQSSFLRSEGAGITVWFTGLSSAGKSTISQAVYKHLQANRYRVELLDGDFIRQHLSKDLGFTQHDRNENIRRIGFVAELLTRNGIIVLVAAISPYRGVRDEMRRRIGRFIEVYVNAPLDVVEKRDVKGIYRRARAGELQGVTGLDDPYEAPISPELECQTDRETVAESACKVIEALEQRFKALQ